MDGIFARGRERKAEEILAAHRAELDLLVEHPLQEETLSNEAMDRLFGQIN